MGTLVSGSTYEITFPSLSGTASERTVTVFAEDVNSNIASFPFNIIIGSGSIPDTSIPYGNVQNYQFYGERIRSDNELLIVFSVNDFGSGVAAVTTQFDVNGNGTIEDSEITTAKQINDTKFSATFPEITGPLGNRTLNATIYDYWRNVGSTNFTFYVATNDQTPPTLSIISPLDGQEAALSIPLTFEIDATDDDAVREVRASFDTDGDGTISGSEVKLASIPFGSTSYFVTFGSNGFSGEGLKGPSGNRSISITASDYFGQQTTVSQLVNVVDRSPPGITLNSPKADSSLALGATIALDLTVLDDQAVSSVMVEFDIDGNGTIDTATESITALAGTNDSWTASIGPLAGTSGPRTVTIRATDAEAKETVLTRTYQVVNGGSIVNGAQTGNAIHGSSFPIHIETALGINVLSVEVQIDLNGDGDTSDDGETIMASDVPRDRRYIADIILPVTLIGSVPFTVTIHETGGGSQSFTQNLEVMSDGIYPGAFSERLASIPLAPERFSDTASLGSYPNTFIDALGYTFFIAGDWRGDDELWRTDGTATGTILLGQINPNYSGDTYFGSSPDHFLEYNGALYFDAATGDANKELWRTDGTATGTEAFIDASSGQWDPTYLTPFDGKIFYSAHVTGYGRELMSSDGTVGGTGLFFDVLPGTLGSDPEHLTVMNGMLYFIADERELWKTDGTVLGTEMVYRMVGSSGSNILNNLKAAGNQLFFDAFDTATGRELWTSDGTLAGTAIVKDIVTGTGTSLPGDFFVHNNKLYFTAETTEQGRELWISDGTELGTYMLQDIFPGTISSEPGEFVSYGGEVYFSANDGFQGREIWKTDGTISGTQLAVNVAVHALADSASNPYASKNSTPRDLTVFNGYIYFSADDGLGDYGRELWRTDGTQSGTELVLDINPQFFTPNAFLPSYIEPVSSDPKHLIASQGKLYFQAEDASYGTELWCSDGTPAGTYMVRNIAHTTPSPFFKFGSNLFFPASTLSAGDELWKLPNGSQQAHQLLDINLGPEDSTPDKFSLFGSEMFFSASDADSIFTGAPNQSLWKSDGTTIGTIKLKTLDKFNDFFWNNGMEPVGSGSDLLFLAQEGYDRELWITDRTPTGTLQLVDINAGDFTESRPMNPVGLGTKVVFSAEDITAGHEPWVTDGTALGTVRLADIRPGSGDSNPVGLTEINGNVYFFAYDPASGTDLWKTDGTPAGTSLFYDINPGSGASYVSTIPEDGPVFNHFQGEWYFAAYQDATGDELWKTDGTLVGTGLVADIDTSGPFQGSHPRRFTPVGTSLYFVADNAVGNLELWVTDGTGPGTSLVKDIRPRHPTGGYSQSSNPLLLTPINGRLFFTAFNDPIGREPWISDGTELGTVMLGDLFTGEKSSDISQTTVIGNQLFFVADDQIHGRELWVTDGTIAGTYLYEDLIPGPESSNPQHLTHIDGDLYYIANDGGKDLSLRRINLGASSSQTYDQWLDTVSTLTGADRELGADPNNNGLTNVQEYGLGGNPETVGPSLVQPTYSLSLDTSRNVYFDYTFRRRTDRIARGLSYYVLSSYDLINWRTTGYSIQAITPIDADFEEITVRFFSPSSKLFITLDVVLVE